ncbi:MAG: dihydroorotase [Candidatus Nitronauta litoralis]|uniref:Dihydroorotase n=1 Tax=Candidatus Nitronauta litoralis TaxID=2705533 RepID=A0A7T0BYN5_9BACT|nr:MAG: dihydroorotase [Candidatus Nitronauta litoralis]
MKILIKGGRLIDPANEIDGPHDLLIEKGKIKQITSPGGISESQSEGAKIIDATGLVVSPGFLDMHVHFREPGYEYKETIETGCQSAVAGGFTGVAVMPNTNPVNDNRSVTELILSQSKAHAGASVYPIPAISRGLKGEQLTDMAELAEAGAIGFSDDGRPVTSNELMRRALEYSKMFDLPIIQHSEVLDLTAGGCMNEGLISTELGLKGMPTEAEDIMVYRDISLLPKTGGRLHVAHISSGGAVELVRQAKAKGLPVTCEVAPHHFILTDESVRGYDTNTKMSPPLRALRDVEAVKEGMKDGTIDIIATDHAPHADLDKEVEYSCAAFGIVGLETALPLSMEMVTEEVITLPRMIDMLTASPAKLFKLDKGNLAEGKDADITIFDPDTEYTIDISKFRSKSKNSPFDGRKVRGRVRYTLVKGKILFSEN